MNSKLERDEIYFFGINRNFESADISVPAPDSITQIRSLSPNSSVPAGRGRRLSNRAANRIVVSFQLHPSAPRLIDIDFRTWTRRRRSRLHVAGKSSHSGGEQVSQTEFATNFMS
jgi:hypothetical protein